MDAIVTYNKIAKRYHKASKKSFYNSCLEMPAMKKMFRGNQLAGKKLLDLGCGSGRYSKWAFSLGAKVTGIDPSNKLLDIAKRENPKAKFYQGTAGKLPFKDSMFDTVISGLVFDYVEDLKQAFQEVFRVLKKNGLFVFSKMNPYTGTSHRIKGTSRYRFDDYFTERWYLKHFKPYGVRVPFYHITFEKLIKMILEAGFSIEDYVDAKPQGVASKKFPREYKRNIDRPFFLVFKLRKP